MEKIPRPVRGRHRRFSGERAINKKTVFLIAGLFGLILGGELLLPVMEEAGMLAFEWAHKSLDLFYQHVFSLDDETAPKASAWTGLFLLIALLGWAGYWLRLKYLRAKDAAPQWWAEKKAGWSNLPWLHKLAYVAAGLLMLGILAMFI